MTPLLPSSNPPPAAARPMSTSLLAPRAGAAVTSPAPLIDVVVPVHNEQATLESSVRRLHHFLCAELPVHAGAS